MRLKAKTHLSKPSRTVNDIIFGMSEQQAKDLLRTIVVAVEETEADVKKVEAKSKVDTRRAAGFEAVLDALVSTGEQPEPEQPPLDPVAFQEALKKDVVDAKERLAHLEREETMADERCMGTPLSDPQLGRYRDLSTQLGHRVEDAKEALAKAERDLRELGEP